MTTPGAGTWARCSSSAPTCGWGVLPLRAGLHASTATSPRPTLAGAAVCAADVPGQGRHQVPGHGPAQRGAAVRREVAAPGRRAVHALEHDRYDQRRSTPTTAPQRTSSPSNFNNAWRIALGVNYFSSEKWTFRGGLAWDQSPVNDQNRTVRLPDNDRYWLVAGRAVQVRQGRRAGFRLRAPVRAVARASTRPSSLSSCGRASDNHQQRDRRLRQLGRHHRRPADLDVLKPQHEGRAAAALSDPPSEAPMPSSPPFHVHKVAVLGAGVMGAQIAAHLVNANVPAVLFELPAKEGDPNGNVAQGHRRPEEARAQPAGERGEGGVHRGRQLRSAPRAAARVRPGDRGDGRAHRHQEGAVRQGRAVSWRRTRSSPATLPACRSTRSPRRCRRRCAGASAACTSSIRRATCTWSS